MTSSFFDKRVKTFLLKLSNIYRVKTPFVDCVHALLLFAIRAAYRIPGICRGYRDIAVGKFDGVIWSDFYICMIVIGRGQLRISYQVMKNLLYFEVKILNHAYISNHLFWLLSKKSNKKLNARNIHCLFMSDDFNFFYEKKLIILKE